MHLRYGMQTSAPQSVCSAVRLLTQRKACSPRTSRTQTSLVANVHHGLTFLEGALCVAGVVGPYLVRGRRREIAGTQYVRPHRALFYTRLTSARRLRCTSSYGTLLVASPVPA